MVAELVGGKPGASGVWGRKTAELERKGERMSPSAPDRVLYLP